MGSPPFFTDKTVVITGSAGGLGLEMGRRFAEVGAVVVLSMAFPLGDRPTTCSMTGRNNQLFANRTRLSNDICRAIPEYISPVTPLSPPGTGAS